MRVRAAKVGFYNGFRRRVGDEFTLPDPKHFSKKWMERVDAPASAKAVQGKEPQTLSEMNAKTAATEKKMQEAKEGKKE